MLSQTTLSQSRDRDGAGTSAALVVCPDDLSAQVGSLSYSELAVALAASGLPLNRGMSAEEVVSVAAAGVLGFGLRRVRARSAEVLELNRALVDQRISGREHAVSYRELFGSERRWKLAINAAWLHKSRARIAAFHAQWLVAEPTAVATTA